mgnify:CR=1 FL=1
MKNFLRLLLAWFGFNNKWIDTIEYFNLRWKYRFYFSARFKAIVLASVFLICAAWFGFQYKSEECWFFIGAAYSRLLTLPRFH